MFIHSRQVDLARPPIELRHVSKKFVLQSQPQRSLQEQFIHLFRRRSQVDEKASFWPLHDISLTVNHGDTIGVMGPNGTGKSTLLKLITGIIEPDQGDVIVNGALSSLLELGAGFHQDLSGRDNIYLNASIYGLRRAEISRRLDKIIEFSELGKFIDMPVKHYSSGMYVRLGFSVAIHTSPHILLVDEVLAVGDAHFQTKCLDAIQQFRNDGGTLILVTHDLGVIQTICNRALWFEHGRLQADGSPIDVVMAYKNQIAEQENAAAPQAVRTLQSDNRWGNGTVEITDVTLYDADDTPRSVFYTAASLNIRIAYEIHAPVEELVIGLAIHHQSGVHITGPNTAQEDIALSGAPGPGAVTFQIPALSLLEGTYTISVAATNRTDTEMFDYQDRAYRFRVFPGECREEHGLVTINGHWRSVQPDALSADDGDVRSEPAPQGG